MVDMSVYHIRNIDIPRLKAIPLSSAEAGRDTNTDSQQEEMKT